MDRPRRGDFLELRQVVEKQLRGPVADQVRSQLSRWSDPAAKLERRKKRAAAAMWFFIFLALLLGVVGAVIATGTADTAVLSGAVAGVFALGSLALGAKSGGRLRRLNKTPIPSAVPTLPPARSAAREPMERLADAERVLADLLRQLSSPRSAVPADSVEDARRTGVEAASALREVAGELQAVERARDMAPAADRAVLDDGVRRMREQLDEGLEGYGTLIAAAGRLVAASSAGGPDNNALTDATDRLHGLAVALREIFPDRR
ncbi:phage shock envelope stress response protein PspM [Kibdelosporangium phytohabitans]|uniref:Uncharacterized protein n=1 Tax=Kibdelosporangium phytohabitans TaxID=860235 RepID=A0A0N7F503_9PSEU|nr:hypothetical protein [Kibdelosporangium phytohabitans]ALG12871.1 hypothetical protein AOZ06_43840 [Kibdelosporangium phytohabitans]MBE1464571.1 hypothetical protein [Kibdelosporangium phytohabitans]